MNRTKLIKTILEDKRINLKPKYDSNHVGYAKYLIENLVKEVKQDENYSNYINYLDEYGKVVMEYDTGSKYEKG